MTARKRREAGSKPHAGLDGQACEGCSYCGDGAGGPTRPHALLAELMSQCSEEERLLLHALYTNRMSIPACAQELGMAVEAMRRRHGRLLGKLRGRAIALYER